MESGQRVKFPLAMEQLAEQYRVGQPLALYNMHPRWLHFWKVFRHGLLGMVIFVAIVLLVSQTIFLHQLFTGQIPYLQTRLILDLTGTSIGLMGCVTWLSMRHMIAQSLPTSILVCTEGLLEIRPKGVEVTRWDEVKWLHQETRLGKKKHYTLYRIKRKPFSFGEIFEDVEGLADLVSQYTQKVVI